MPDTMTKQPGRTLGCSARLVPTLKFLARRKHIAYNGRKKLASMLEMGHPDVCIQ